MCIEFSVYWFSSNHIQAVKFVLSAPFLEFNALRLGCIIYNRVKIDNIELEAQLCKLRKN